MPYGPSVMCRLSIPGGSSLPVATFDLAVTSPGSLVLIRVLDNDQRKGPLLVGLGSPARGSVVANMTKR
jgi:hypothetical protein